MGAAALLVAGGDLVRLVERSAFFSGTLLPILLPKLGVDQAAIDYGAFPPSFYPESAIFQTLLDRGDAMSFAPILRARSTNVLLQMAADDETVPNSATEGLARAVGAQILDAEPSFTDLPRGESPASANYETDGARVTRHGRAMPLPTGDLGHAVYCIGLTADFRRRPQATMDAHVGVLGEVLRHGRFDSFLYLSSARLYRNAKTGAEDAAIRLLQAELVDALHLHRESRHPTRR